MKKPICLVVEGTYPYVFGGVSAWVHMLLGTMREFPFHLYHIGSLPAPDRRQQYRLPENVSSLSEVFIHAVSLSGIGADPYPRKTWRAIEEFHQRMKQGDVRGFPALLGALAPGGNWPAMGDILNSPPVWEILARTYRASCPAQSFIDYFWTWRFMHLPLIKLLSTPPPRADLYHATSTGYAGIAAAAAGIRNRRPVIITEHGLYTMERRLEVDRAPWIYAPEEQQAPLTGEASYFRGMWVRYFDSLARIAYQGADRVTALSSTLQREQAKLGADPSRMVVIPNGLDLSAFQENPPSSREGPRVAFVGRVVAIKDVKRFIKACRLVAEEVPGASFAIYGPTEEEPEYAAACRNPVRVLGLEGKVAFMGEQPIERILPEVDILALTSHVEAQPLVVMEAMAAGVPVVAPDVGACAELLRGGSDPADRELGVAGIVTPAGGMEQVAAAIIRLSRSPRERRAMGQSGRARIARFYRLDTLIDRYRSLYETLQEEARDGGDRA